MQITLTDERQTDSKTGEAKRLEFKYTGGIAEFIKHLNRGKSVLHDRPIYMEAERDSVQMEIALQYNDGYSETVFSFANNINTVDGGSHLSGFRTSLTRTINYAGQQLGLFKDVKENLAGDDVREGLVAVVSVTGAPTTLPSGAIRAVLSAAGVFPLPQKTRKFVPSNATRPITSESSCSMAPIM